MKPTCGKREGFLLYLKGVILMAGTEIISAASVDELTVAIKDDLAQAAFHGKLQALHYIRAGQNLIRLKEQLPHGSWRSWLAEHFNCDERTARNYMQAARIFGKSENVFRFGWSAILALLKLPPAEVDDFIARNPVAEMSARQLQAAVKDWNNRNTVDVEAVISSPSTALVTVSTFEQLILPGFEPPSAVVPEILVPELLREAAGETPIFFRKTPPCEPPLILVCRADTTALYFHRLMNNADAVCFAGRLKFPLTDGGIKSFPAVIFCFGCDVAQFLQTFRKFGSCVQLKQKSSNAQRAEALL